MMMIIAKAKTASVSPLATDPVLLLHLHSPAKCRALPHRAPRPPQHATLTLPRPVLLPPDLGGVGDRRSARRPAAPPRGTQAQAPGSTIPADFKALTTNLDVMGCGGTPGTVAVFGTGSFPLVMDEDGRRAIVAAGRSSVGGRALAAGHTSWEGPADGKRQLWENFATWAGRKARPVLAFSPGHPARPPCKARASRSRTSGRTRLTATRSRAWTCSS